jgi:hypothetical protein
MARWLDVMGSDVQPRSQPKDLLAVQRPPGSVASVAPLLEFDELLAIALKTLVFVWRDLLAPLGAR